MIQLQLPIPPTDGKAKLASVLKTLGDHPLHDIVLPATALLFVVDGGGKQLTLNTLATGPLDIHPFALKQLCVRVRLPPAYAYGLLHENTNWALELLSTTLNTLFQQRAKGHTFLIRHVDKQVRGFLSNSYKCLDVAHLIRRFAEYAQATGAEPYDAAITPLHVAVYAALPNTWDVGNQRLRVGVTLRNSEFGAGPTRVHIFLTNQHGWIMTGRKGVTRVHRGQRLGLLPGALERARRESSEEVAAAMKEKVFRYLKADNVSAAIAEVALASETSLEVDAITSILETLALEGSEAEKVLDTFTSTRADLPEGFTTLRLAATLAWLAGETPDPERRLALEDSAGSLILQGARSCPA